MSGRAAAALRFGFVAAAAIGYDLLSFYCTTRSAPAWAGAALSLLAPLLLLGGFLLRSRSFAKTLLVAALLGALLWWSWPLLERHFTQVFLLQQLFLWVALLVLFANSLRPGQTPLCTQVAVMLRSPLPEDERRYTRRVTQAWCLFFAAMALTGLLLFLLAPRHVWSAFNNLWTLPLVGLMFALEYSVRLLALPRRTHAGPFEAVRAYSQSRR